MPTEYTFEITRPLRTSPPTVGGVPRYIRPPLNFTLSDCELPINGLSYAPKSTRLRHTKECTCTRTEEADLAFVCGYILDWVHYRMDKLGESAMQATAWARISCDNLRIHGLERRLDLIEAAAAVLEQRGGTVVCWTDL